MTRRMNPELLDAIRAEGARLAAETAAVAPVAKPRPPENEAEVADAIVAVANTTGRPLMVRERLELLAMYRGRPR